MNTRFSFLGSYFGRKSVQKIILEKILVYILLLTMGLLFLFPLFWMGVTSFKDEAQLYIPKPKILPNPLVWANYKEAWGKIPFPLYTRNTTIITLSSVFLAVLSTSLVAFGFARINFKGRDFLFSLLLASMILPGMVQIIPRYFIWNWLHCLDTWTPLILPNALGGYAFYIFLMRQFYRSLPLELDDAAAIDGCSYFRIWWNIMLPLTKPALTVVALFTFMRVWNDFFEPLIYLTTNSRKTLALGLRFFQGQFGTDIHLLMAASTLVLLPCLVIFLFAQKYFIKGIAMSGIKG